MLGELAGQLQRLGAHVADVASALTLTASRIRDAMAAHERMNLTKPGQRGAIDYEDQTEPNSDTDLFALRPAWDRLSVAQNAANHALLRAQGLCDEDRAPVPAPLLAKAGDDMLVWLDVAPSICRYKGAFGDQWYGDEESLPSLNAALTRAKEVDQNSDMNAA